MMTLLESYRQKRDSARAELREIRVQVQQVVDADDLTWNEKLEVLEHAWAVRIKSILPQTAPKHNPGMHPSCWNIGREYKHQCELFLNSMDSVLADFPPPTEPKKNILTQEEARRRLAKLDEEPGFSNKEPTRNFEGSLPGGNISKSPFHK